MNGIITKYCSSHISISLWCACCLYNLRNRVIKGVGIVAVVIWISRRLIQPRLALNSLGSHWFSLLYLPSTVITGSPYLVLCWQEIRPMVSCIPSKHSASWAASLAPKVILFHILILLSGGRHSWAIAHVWRGGQALSPAKPSLWQVVGEMTLSRERHLQPSLMTWAQLPGPTWWKEKTHSIQVVLCPPRGYYGVFALCTLACIHIHTNK